MYRPRRPYSLRVRVGEGETILFAEVPHALEIELYPIANFEGRLSGRGLPGLRRFLEQVLESSWGDDLQYPARPVAGVPEGVPLVAGLEDEVALCRVDDLVAELCAHAPLQDVAVLVLVRVAMKRCGECSRGDRMLDEGEPPAGFLAPDHEPNAERSEIDSLPVARPEDARAPRGCRTVGRRHSSHVFPPVPACRLLALPHGQTGDSRESTPPRIARTLPTSDTGSLKPNLCGLLLSSRLEIRGVRGSNTGHVVPAGVGMEAEIVIEGADAVEDAILRVHFIGVDGEHVRG